MPAAALLARRGLLKPPGLNRALRQLSAVSAPPTVAYGLTRMIAGYAGAAMPVAGADVGFLSDNRLDLPAVDVRSRGWYDQTGKGGHATVSNTAPSDFPTLTTLRRAFGANWPDIPIAMCNGEWAYNGQDTTYYQDVSRGFTLPASVTSNRGSFACFLVFAPQNALPNNSYLTLGNPTGTSRLVLLNQPANPGVDVFHYAAASGSTVLHANALPPMCLHTGLQVVALISRGSGFEVRINDQVWYASSALEALALTGGLLGMSPSGTFRTKADFRAFALYPELPAADVDTIMADLMAMHEIDTAPKTVIVYTGSSTQEGQGCKGNVTAARLALGKMLKPQPRLYNFGVAGRTLEFINQQFAVELRPVIQFWKARGARVIAWQGGGSNDIQQAATSQALLSRGQTFVNAAKAAGADHVVGETLFPRGDNSASANTQKDTFNGAIMTAGIYDTVVDTGRIPELQDPTNTLYYVADKIHRKNPGAELHAALMAPVFDQLIQ